MGIIVQKFGGSSLSTIEKIKKVAQRVVDTKNRGHSVVVVVSAMGKTTDSLLGMAKELTDSPDHRELDMLLSIGERQTISLLSMAIKSLGVPAISLTGSQSGIITNTAHNQAKILEVRPYRIEDALAEGKIVIVAGFQGVSYLKEITTLGRGGSDTTALALSAALNAMYCEIFSDVDGVYSADPRVVSLPAKLDEVSFDQMLEMAENGAKVLAADAIRFAKYYKIKLYSKHSFTTTEGTFITDETIVRDIVSVTSEKDLLFVSIKQEDSNSFIVYLMEHNILYREIWSSDGKTTTLFDTKNIHQYPLFIKDLTNFGFEFQENYGRVTMIGNQLYSNPSILINALHILKTESIPTFGHHLSHIKCSVIIEKEFVDKVVQLFHQKFIESV